MSRQLICDLCGRPLREDARAFKIKEKQFHCLNKIDCHEECLRVLLLAAQKRREEEQQGVQEPYLIDRNELLKDLNATMAYDARISTIIMAQPRR